MRMLVLVAASVAVALAAPEARGGDVTKPRSVAVYALSRGQGVPPATREAYGKARVLLQDLEREKAVSHLTEKRIGLEGESRMCVELMDAKDPHEVVEKLRAIAKGVELMNVVEEPCRTVE